MKKRRIIYGFNFDIFKNVSINKGKVKKKHKKPKMRKNKGYYLEELYGGI